MLSETEAALHAHLTEAEDERDDYGMRLLVIKNVLGLLSSDNTREGRAMYLAFQIASDGIFNDRAKDAARTLVAADPDYLRAVADHARDFEDSEVAVAIASLTKEGSDDA